MFKTRCEDGKSKPRHFGVSLARRTGTVGAHSGRFRRLVQNIECNRASDVKVGALCVPWMTTRSEMKRYVWKVFEISQQYHRYVAKVLSIPYLKEKKSTDVAW